MNASVPVTSLIHMYHKFVDDGAFYVHHGECNAGEFGYVLAGLAGEAGEAIGEHKKLVRKTGVKDDAAYQQALMDNDAEKLHLFIKELGDVLWYLTRMCSVLGLTLGDLMVLNTLKLYERHVINSNTNAHQLDMEWPYDFMTYVQAVKMRDTLPIHVQEYFNGASHAKDIASADI